MKYILSFLAFMLITNFCFSQSSNNLNITSKNAENKTEVAFDIRNLPTFGLNGLGNVNTETFTDLNAGGKLAGYIRPYKGKNSFITVNFSFNVNASNSDSLLAGTFLFPDVGRTSFYSLIDWTFLNNKTYLITPFFEFANKNIKAMKNDSARNFSSLGYTLGVRGQYIFSDEKDMVSFSVAPFYAIINVPDEDNEDYRYLFTGNYNSTLNSAVRAWGVKVGFQYNNFQIFADLRNVLGDNKRIPLRELRGFNSNIGVVFNAEVFEK